MPDLSTVVNMFFGADNNKVLYALIILVTLDYITGVCVAIKDKKLSSSIGAKGIINKVVIFIMVSLSHVVDSYLLSSGVALERITILFYCANEAISILENAGKIGVPLPEKLLAHLNSFKEKNSLLGKFLPYFIFGTFFDLINVLTADLKVFCYVTYRITISVYSHQNKYLSFG